MALEPPSVQTMRVSKDFVSISPWKGYKQDDDDEVEIFGVNLPSED